MMIIGFKLCHLCHQNSLPTGPSSLFSNIFIQKSINCKSHLQCCNGILLDQLEKAHQDATNVASKNLEKVSGSNIRHWAQTDQHLKKCMELQKEFYSVKNKVEVGLLVLILPPALGFRSFSKEITYCTDIFV